MSLDKAIKYTKKEDEAMIELIPSKHVRDYMDEIGYKLSDYEKATLIWNAVGYTHQQIMDSLTEIAKYTDDEETRMQIVQRVQYEEEMLKRFKTNQDNQYVYVVNDDDVIPCGYFRRYETALAYAKKQEGSCLIEKQLIVDGDEIPMMEYYEKSNPHLFPDEDPNKCEEYWGAAQGTVFLNEDGEILIIWSREMGDQEHIVEDVSIRERFEDRFVNIPFPPTFMKGIPVKHIPSSRYGIIQAGSEIWDKFIDRINKGLYVDYSDMCITVQFIGEDGNWCHDHINPIYLEVGMPDFKENPELCRAMDSLSEYWSGKENAEHEEMVIKFSREYAIKHQKKLDADTATKLEDIMF